MSAVFFDLSKAFDTVDHNRLLSKIQYVGIRGIALKWITSYLSDREQLVCVAGSTSKPKHIKTGVPQGSVLGPILFTLYVNDLPSAVTCDRVVMYADDTCFISAANNQFELQNKVQSSIDEFSSWCHDNSLCLNANKSQYMVFHTSQGNNKDANLSLMSNNSLLAVTHSSNFLGITITDTLSWAQHVSNLSTKLAHSLFALRKIHQSCYDFNLDLTVYYAYFYQHAKYGIMFWGSSTAGLHRIFLLQKKAIRIIFNLGFRDSCKEYFAKHNILTIPSMYIYFSLCYIHKHKNSYALLDSQHNYQTRHNNKIILPKCNLSLFYNSPEFSALRMYNTLPNQVTTLPYSKFKTVLKRRLISLCLYSVTDFKY